MDSPRARPPGTFNWESTLWHEMAHVITLQMSRQRAPRWLSEGLSVYEEQRARPDWGREMEVAFAKAIGDGKVLPVAELNAGLMSPETIGLAYFQAAVLVDHIASEHGEPAIHAMLRAYGEGMETESVLQNVLRTDFNRLQAAFDRTLERRFGRLRRALEAPSGLSGGERPEDLARIAEQNDGSYPVQMALGQALRAAGDVEGAVKALERAAALVPMATGRDNPRRLLAEIAEGRGDRERALTQLAALVEQDHTGIEAARQLAAWADESNDEPRRWLAYRRIVEIDPFDPKAHAALGRLALARGETAVAVREFMVALETEPVDRAAAHCDLAESYLAAGQTGEAKVQALAALEIAPSYERAQDLLLQAAEGRP
jgi:tetratricopeptide (TPR) repeat protein